jgi:hypothetical protein
MGGRIDDAFGTMILLPMAIAGFGILFHYRNPVS